MVMPSGWTPIKHLRTLFRAKDLVGRPQTWDTIERTRSDSYTDHDGLDTITTKARGE
jgi:hypothetical protein